jgi:hypothetical protein
MGWKCRTFSVTLSEASLEAVKIKSMLDNQLANLLFMREMMRAGGKDTKQVTKDIAEVRMQIAERKK